MCEMELWLNDPIKEKGVDENDELVWEDGWVVAFAFNMLWVKAKEIKFSLDMIVSYLFFCLIISLSLSLFYVNLFLSRVSLRFKLTMKY